jgi:serine protease AprX
MNTIIWINFFCIMMISCVSSSAALAGKIHPVLGAELQALNTEDEVSVIVHLTEQQDIKQFKGNDKKIYRSWLKRSLKDKADKSQKQLKKFLQQKNGRKIIPFWIVNAIAVTLRAGDIDELVSQPGVESVQLDGFIYQPQPLAANASAPEWNLSAINAPEFWAMGHTGAGVVIAGMDTGVDAAHQDLISKWRGGSNSWYDPNGEHATPYDKNGHGTQTMGVMVGGEAGGSAIGVAPGASWIAVKLFNDLGVASASAIHLGFQWLLDPDDDPNTDDLPDVVNNSWGFGELTDQCLSEFQPDIQILRAAGVAVVFSAGNGGPNSFTSISPANNQGSFAVGSVDDALNIAASSSRGPSACNGDIYPEIVSPGVNIKTTDLTFGGLFPDSYTYVSGTSIAAPHTSGAMALLLNASPQLTVDELESSLAQSAADLGNFGWDNDYGNGLVDVVAAYNLIQSGIGTCADVDGDGYPGEAGCVIVQDCNDGDPALYPGAVEIKHDTIDQDCNGYDLTIDIIRAEYRVMRDGLVVWASSGLGQDALLQVDVPGIGLLPMSWNESRQLWKSVVRDASLNGYNPDTPGMEIVVNGHEGALSATINTR